MRRLAAFAVLCALASMPASSSRAAARYALTRVTTYLDYGVTYSGTVTTAGRTAGCALEHLGQTVTLLNAGLTLVCEDSGAAWWFAEDSNRVDVYGLWLGEDYDLVEFQ